VGKKNHIDFALAEAELPHADWNAPPSVKKQFLISRFYERAWTEPIQIGYRRAGAKQCDLEIAVSFGLGTDRRAKKEGQQSDE
jgi:hypothetical protein